MNVGKYTVIHISLTGVYCFEKSDLCVYVVKKVVSGGDSRAKARRQ